MISLHSEVVRVLEREKMVCNKAIDRLHEESRSFEEEYGWSTQVFLQKFNQGEVGDDQPFFRWYALAEATKDWQKIRNELDSLLSKSEGLSA